LSFHDRRTDQVYAVFYQLAQEKKNQGVSPGEINEALRQQGRPMGAWEVRGELTKLERLGAITLDARKAVWLLVTDTEGQDPSVSE